MQDLWQNKDERELLTAWQRHRYDAELCGNTVNFTDFVEIYNRRLRKSGTAMSGQTSNSLAGEQAPTTGPITPKRYRKRSITFSGVNESPKNSPETETMSDCTNTDDRVRESPKAVSTLNSMGAVPMAQTFANLPVRYRLRQNAPGRIEIPQPNFALKSPPTTPKEDRRTSPALPNSPALPKSPGLPARYRLRRNAPGRIEIPPQTAVKVSVTSPQVQSPISPPFSTRTKALGKKIVTNFTGATSEVEDGLHNEVSSKRECAKKKVRWADTVVEYPPRPREQFNRKSPAYQPGRWSCPDEQGWQDTSWKKFLSRSDIVGEKNAEGWKTYEDEEGGATTKEVPPECRTM